MLTHQRRELTHLLLLTWLFAPYFTYVAWHMTGNDYFFGPTAAIMRVAIAASLAGSISVFCFGLWRAFWQRDILSMGLIILFICYVVVLSLITLISPLSSWDALGGEWGVHSFAELAIRISAPEFGGDTPRAPRHPPLVPYMLAAGAANDYLPAYESSGVSVVWLSFLLAPLALLYRIVGSTLGDKVGAFVCVSLVTIPLLENHVGLTGYYEIFVWSLLQIVAVLLLLRTTQEIETSYITIGIALLLSAALILTKSLATLYIGVIWLSYAASHCSFRIVLALTLIVAGALLFFSAVGLSKEGSSYSVPAMSFIGNDSQVAFSNRLTDFRRGNIIESIVSVFLSLFKNASFSVSASFFMIVTALTFKNVTCSKAAAFNFFTALGILAAFVLVGLTSYLADNGAWGRDTLLSRSLLPAIILLPLYLCCLLGSKKICS